MTINEAIESLINFKEDNHKALTVEEYHAINLGIESMRMLEQFRSGPIPDTFWLLPGETKK